MDESHDAKNPRSILGEAVKALSKEKVLLLTGTPVYNRWTDLFGQLRLLKNFPFVSADHFKAIFQAPKCNNLKAAQARNNSNRQRGTPSAARLQILSAFLLGFLVRRPKEIVPLPGFSKVDVPVDLFTPEQRSVLCVIEKATLSAKRLRQMAQDAGKGQKKKLLRRMYSQVAKAELHQQTALITTYGPASGKNNGMGDNQEDDEEDDENHNMNCVKTVERLAQSWYEKKPQDMDGAEFLMFKHRYIEEKLGRTVEMVEGPSNGTPTSAAVTIDPEVLLDPDYDENDPDNIDPEDDIIFWEDDDDSDCEDDDEDDEYDTGQMGKTSRAHKQFTENWLQRLKTLPDDEIFSSFVNAVLATLHSICGPTSKERVLVVCKSLMVLDVVDEAIRRAIDRDREGFDRIVVVHYNGTIETKERLEVLRAFNKESDTMTDRDPNVLLLTSAAGGTGLNITGATHLIKCDTNWSPGDETQIDGRIYRIGQTKPVTFWKVTYPKSPIQNMISRSLLGKQATSNALTKALERKDDRPYFYPHIPSWEELEELEESDDS